MSLAQPVSKQLETGASKEALFLNWFAQRFQAEVLIKKVTLGSLSYFRCFALHDEDEDIFLTTGRAQNPELAAIKCAAEFVERKTFLKYSRFIPPESSGTCLLDLKDNLLISHGTLKQQVAPRKFRSSNGWAVHFSKEMALKNALFELIERHCLMLSFLKHSWAGFDLINEISIQGVCFLSLVSNISVGPFRAGMVVAIHPETKGVSFGYMCERSESILTSPKWLHALQEAYDQIETFKPGRSALSENFEDRAYRYLASRFEELDLIKQGNSQTTMATEFHESSFYLYDIGSLLACPVPLYCAHVWSEHLLPLFNPNDLSEIETSWLQENFKSLGSFDRLPTRIPIL